MQAPEDSVIMPVAPGRSWRPAGRSLVRAPQSGRPVELLVIEGRHPSRQRNLAAHEAKGEVLYFIDNDSHVRPDTMERLLGPIRARRVDVAGGPAAGSRPRSWLDGIGDMVLASPLGSPLVSRRYRCTDEGVRDAGEKELILCNLMVRRDAFTASGGFDPRLYPNEENELINRLRREGVRTAQVSNAGIEKPRDYSIVRFMTESFRYGLGRMKQIWTNPAPGDLPFIAVPAAAAVFAFAVARHPEAAWAAGVYAGAVVFEGVRMAAGSRRRRSGLPAFTFDVLGVAALIAFRHAAYFCGLVWGVATGWRARRLRLNPMRMLFRRFLLRGGSVRDCGARTIDIGFCHLKEAD